MKKLILFILFLHCSLSAIQYEVYFSPDDNVAQKFIDYVNHEQQRIDIAIYTLTHAGIISALINAYKRGVSVNIVIDQFSLKAVKKNNGIKKLIAANVPVYLFDPKNDELHFEPNSLTSIFQRIRLEDLMELSLEKAYSILENNYTDIIVPDKYIQLFNLTRFIDLLKDCKYKKIEARSEKAKLDESLDNIIEDQNGHMKNLEEWASKIQSSKSYKMYSSIKNLRPGGSKDDK